MTGLSVLYAKEATQEREWPKIPDRDKTGRLREVYWLCRAKPNSESTSFLNINFYWRPDRAEIGRRRDEPGDGFIYLVDINPSMQDRFEWSEVTEVFTTVPAKEIEGAMRAWNGIQGRDTVDFNEFRAGLQLGRPSRMEQRRAADQAIAQIEKKLAKASYSELLDKYGYGTLVVGMPLWFAVPPNDPFRMENAIDDFITRLGLGLEDVKRRMMWRQDCPFRKVVVIWDTSPQALYEWDEEKSPVYGNVANQSLESPMGASMIGILSSLFDKAVTKASIPESETPSISLYCSETAEKKATGGGPYPEFVELFKNTIFKHYKNPIGFWEIMKWKISMLLCKLYCFVRIHGVEGIEQWILRKLSVSRSWRMIVLRQNAQQLYRESRQRGRFL